MQVTSHKERAHAKLAPSAAHRWIECPGSIKLCEGIESKSSVFAAEGTAAHELAAHCLKNGFDADRFADHVIDITATDAGSRFLKPGAPLGDDNTRFEVDEEMVEGVQMYLDHVRHCIGLCEHNSGIEAVEVDVEQRLDMTHVHPSIYGTGDTVIYDAGQQWLHVFDLKYGKGVLVEVPANPQLLTYGSGAVQRYHNRGVKGITLHIVQPRVDHDDGRVRWVEYDLVDLMEFEGDLAKYAKATEAPDAPLKAGDWCRFCPALPFCPEARRHNTHLALEEFADVKPGALTPTGMAQVLAEADNIGNWVKAVQAYAHEQATNGVEIPGYKLVAKRAIRRWKDDAYAAAELEILFDGEELYTEPKLKSPTQVEKTIGKKAFAQVEDLVTKVSSGTNLVPVDDKRQAVKEKGLEEFNAA
jgi:hypothetical protein